MQLAKMPRPGKRFSAHLWQQSQTAHYYIPYILSPQSNIAINRFLPGFYRPGYHSINLETGESTYYNPITPGQQSTIFKYSSPFTSAMGKGAKVKKQMRSSTNRYSRRNYYGKKRKY